VSAAQLFRADIVDLLLHHTRDAGIHPRMIEVELTESTLVEDTEALARIIDDLKRIGTTIAIDDFGTGYSSLSYLKRFKVDKLKIDRAFVSDLGNSPTAEGNALSQLIINIARTLHMRVIAEGVETTTQLDMIRRQGCNEIQGYFFSRPLAAADFPTVAAHLDADTQVT
jgi:EAL domain-containing protein (putative c-di-GMP-specific phosphodiesterase class I)